MHFLLTNLVPKTKRCPTRVTKLVGPKTCLKWGPELPFICLDFVQKSLSKCQFSTTKNYNKNYFHGRLSTPFTPFLLLWLFNSSDAQRNFISERFKTRGFCSDTKAWSSCSLHRGKKSTHSVGFIPFSVSWLVGQICVKDGHLLERFNQLLLNHPQCQPCHF